MINNNMTFECLPINCTLATEWRKLFQTYFIFRHAWNTDLDATCLSCECTLKAVSLTVRSCRTAWYQKWLTAMEYVSPQWKGVLVTYRETNRNRICFEEHTFLELQTRGKLDHLSFSPYAEVNSVGIFCSSNHLASSSTTPFEDSWNPGWTSGGMVGPPQMTFKVDPYDGIWSLSYSTFLGCLS